MSFSQGLYDQMKAGKIQVNRENRIMLWDRADMRVRIAEQGNSNSQFLFVTIDKLAKP